MNNLSFFVDDIGELNNFFLNFQPAQKFSSLIFLTYSLSLKNEKFISTSSKFENFFFADGQNSGFLRFLNRSTSKQDIDQKYS